METISDIAIEFIRLATWHGTLEQADKLLNEHPGLKDENIFTAAVLGNAPVVKQFIEDDIGNVTLIAPPYGGNALVYLCLSKYLRLDPEKVQNFIDCAKILLDAGADPNSGFMTRGDFPEFETALYGAAGVAHHAGLTRLLLERGADPNDVEAVYHSPETYENDAMKALVETGKVSTDNLSMMLVRKHDWHDYEGAKYLLEHGADPNGDRSRGWYPIHHALARDNHVAMIALLLDYHADINIISSGLNTAQRAAREGRADVLKLFSDRGLNFELQGIDKLIAACASGNESEVKDIIKDDPGLVSQLIQMGGELMATFCGTGNAAGVAQLLNLGVDVNARFIKGDGYFDIAPFSLPIHIAAWRMRPDTVKLLIACGADITAHDGKGRTPLMLAHKACTDSYWKERCSLEVIKELGG